MLKNQNPAMFIGETAQKQPGSQITGEYVSMLNGELFYKIKNYDAMDPFFMSLVSSSNHWMFISSTGGLSAGRVSAEQALFPYYTVDKLTENNENTGPKAIFRVTPGQTTANPLKTSLWEPFSELQHGSYQIERNIYKNVGSTALVFEEINRSLGLTYRYAWRSSDAFGFIKTSWLINSGGEAACHFELIDGLQNILPANVTMQTQNTFSCLLDAYKRSELDTETGIGIFSLNATLTDLAEPSESLLANTVAQIGFEHAGYLLSTLQLDQFRAGIEIESEVEVRGQRCAYFVHASLDLAAGAQHCWHLVADVSQDSAAIVRLANQLRQNRSNLPDVFEREFAANNANLEKIVAGSDGLQLSGNPLCTAHHFANVMFNVMRGGSLPDGYLVRAQDFIEFVNTRNRAILDENAAFFSELPAEMNIAEMKTRTETSGQPDLIRLGYAYLPLSFSRRHGDPSRPWNRFVIDIKKPDGSAKLGYEGNWRDIFQNWEALAYAYPEYIENMICTFLNATTADGYNPYRITSQGIDWEQPEPHNPWANIGYWSDHQIIYLQKLMEISANVHPGKLGAFLSRAIFSIANVPYRLKPYHELVNDPINTIDFNWDLEKEIEARVQARGTDGKLTFTHDQGVLHITLAEKLLTLLLAKLVNYVPQGGIWMNTQRPEWNDANNALVGKGLSVVTLAYLRRYIVFFKQLLEQAAPGLDQDHGLSISAEVGQFYTRISQIFSQFSGSLNGSFTAEQRRAMLDALGQAGSDYRWAYYSDGFSGQLSQIALSEMVAFLDLTLQYVEETLRANKRSDNLYHAYNILHLEDTPDTLPGSGRGASISHLYEMLEGQVAMLSSGMLSGAESLALLESLKNSQLYRADQHSYILYPDRKLAGFMEKNRVTPEQVSDLKLVAQLVDAQDGSLMTRDENGSYHFSGQIHNLKDVTRCLNTLGSQPRFAELVKAESGRIKALFEVIFHHDEFTGRSGTFFAYEGLGSIYWHMVSKLLLAVQETVTRTRNQPASLIEKYADIRQGLSFNKTPQDYGAFPTDPYSHTPKGQGAKQPGMTGLVKEEILTRQAELGYFIQDGGLVFDFLLLDKNEFLSSAALRAEAGTTYPFSYWELDGQRRQIELEIGSLAYTICQVPVILRDNPSTGKGITVYFKDGSSQQITGYSLDIETSQHIFQRDGRVSCLVVELEG